MQFIRIFVILVGLAGVAIGLYLLCLGLGAPIEIRSIELGAFKASMTGIGAGAAVAAFSCVVIWLAMHYLKQKKSWDFELVNETANPDGSKTTTTTREHFDTQFQQPF